MNKKEIISEFTEFIRHHDSEEADYAALETWMKNGNSPYTNPDHYCMYGDEISFMNWYWILKDSSHPEHRNLLDHRNSMEEDAGMIQEYPGLLKARIEEFLNMDYHNTTLSPGQDWYVGDSTFLSLKETKEHLLSEMEYYREAIKTLKYMAENVEYELSNMNLSGNLFEDVLIVGEVLGVAEMYAEEVLKASRAIGRYEDRFCQNYLNNTYLIQNDLPF